MTEVIHCVEESRRLILQLLNCDLNRLAAVKYEIKEGAGAAAVEAPRGTLYYHVDIDAKGYVKNVNIITPTAQFLSNLEDDVAAYIPRIMNLSELEKERNSALSFEPTILA